jgi:hypothetical protein
MVLKVAPPGNRNESLKKKEKKRKKERKKITKRESKYYSTFLYQPNIYPCPRET